MLHNFLTLLLQLCLASFALAAPVAQDVSASTAGNSWQYGTGGGILGFIVLILDIIVFSKCLSACSITCPPPKTSLVLITPSVLSICAILSSPAC